MILEKYLTQSKSAEEGSVAFTTLIPTSQSIDKKNKITFYLIMSQVLYVDLFNEVTNQPTTK